MSLVYPELTVETDAPLAERLEPSLARAIKMALVNYYDRTCQGCGYHFVGSTPERPADDGVGLEMDHRIPLSRGGDNSVENLWILCLPCHDGKTNRNGEDGLPVNMTEAEWLAAGRPQEWTRKNQRLARRRGQLVQLQARGAMPA